MLQLIPFRVFCVTLPQLAIRNSQAHFLALFLEVSCLFSAELEDKAHALLFKDPA